METVVALWVQFSNTAPNDLCPTPLKMATNIYITPGFIHESVQYFRRKFTNVFLCFKTIHTVREIWFEISTVYNKLFSTVSLAYNTWVFDFFLLEGGVIHEGELYARLYSMLLFQKLNSKCISAHKTLKC